MAAEAPPAIDGYEFVAPIGSGGMGKVWLARDLRLDRRVAIKLLPSQVSTDPDRVARLRLEARAASALNHPNVCTIHALGTAADGQLFLSMEYVEGVTLRERLASQQLSVRDAIEIAAQIAAGLGAAHAAGVVHRDIKPENVMIRSDGLIKVLDFGLARLDPTIGEPDADRRTHTAVHTGAAVAGTIAYMSPEQATGRPLDARTPLTPGRLPGLSFPIWSRDGRRVVYRRFDDLWWVDADGSGRAGRVSGNQPGDIPAAFAPDGDTIAVLRTSTGTGGDVFALSMSGAWPARPLVQTAGYDGGADFSPDGRWLLYASTDSGPSQVYLSPYPAMDRKWTVSTAGGTQPRWSHDGREVFYREGTRMLVVEVTTRGGEVKLSEPRLLFDREFASGGYITIANYDALADGSFVMTESDPGAPRLTVVLNWANLLQRQLERAADGR